MNDINELFFQLIRVSIGVSGRLRKSPTNEEWKMLYEMSKKQSLVGICFAGVQRLQQQQQEPPEMLYLTWMGMAAKIQQRNEVVYRQCAELGERLKSEGYCYCILKGQGVASLYHSLHSEPSSLSLLRQSGDIDVWVQNMSIPELVEYVKGLGVYYKATVAHVECKMIDSTNIELHAKPAFMRSFRTNRKLIKWFNDSKDSIVERELGFYVPTNEFNIVYMMIHMYHHVLFEGLGLRQLMDYYFVLNTLYSDGTFHYDDDNIISTFKSFGMMRFATGIMWIIKEVFLLEDRYLICEANEKYGRLILEDVISGGNFGYHDEKNKGLHGETAVGRSLCGLKRNMKYFALGPWEILSSPIWSLWHWWWRKRHGLL